jgi:hypothetical protein
MTASPEKKGSTALYSNVILGIISRKVVRNSLILFQFSHLALLCLYMEGGFALISRRAHPATVTTL